MAAAVQPWSIMSLNLPENSDSKQQQEILDALPALVFLERAGRIVFANAEARQILGVADGEWTPKPVEEVLWGLFPGTAEPQTLLTGTAKGSPFHATMPARGGRLQPVEGTYSMIDPELREAIIVAHPGGREKAPKSRLMEDVLSSIPEAVAIVYGGHVLYTNPAFTRMFGFTADEVTGGNLRDFIVPDTRQFENATLETNVDEIGQTSLETVRKNKDGELVDVALLAGPLLVNGSKAGYVYSFRNIVERKMIEARLEHDVMHDVLTGLPNRGLFMDRLNLALTRRARRLDQNCGVLFLDLDRFKEINDTLGHAAGDELLIEVAHRLRGSLRPQDTAARLGGDEFGVLVENISSGADLDIVVNRIMQGMQKPFNMFGHPMQANVSIGAAIASTDRATADLLLRDADMAMYRAKQQGGGRFETFDKSLAIHISSRHERERELRQVLEKREFEIRYEPIYRLATGRVEGFEAQLQWRRSDGSVEDFSDLLALADQTGLSITLGRETLEAVCRQWCEWTGGAANLDLTMNLNMTGRQFYHPDMVAQMRRVLDSTGMAPHGLMLEIDETTLSENPDDALVILQRVVDLGVRIAVDNFGAGLAPLNQLVQLPIEVVKMDPKLTAAAAVAGRQLAMVQAMMQLSHTLGVQVMAQSIETREQFEALRRMGCELGQGSYLAKPVEPTQTYAGRDSWNQMPPQ